MNELVLIAGMTLVTFGVRYPVLALVGRMDLPEIVIRALRYVPVAILTAIVVPDLVFGGGGGNLNISAHNAHLVAGVLSILIAWRSKNLILTIILGMLIFLIWPALIH